MDETREQTVRRHVRLVQRTLAPTVVAAVAVVGPMASAEVAHDGRDARPVPGWLVQAEQLADKYDCAPVGLPDGKYPPRVVVKVGGEVREASFAEGWAMHLGKQRGTLVSVCAR